MFEIQAAGNVHYDDESLGDLDRTVLEKLDPDARALALLWADVNGSIDPASPFRVYAWRPKGQRGRVYLESEFTLGSPFHKEIGRVEEVFDDFTRGVIVDQVQRLASAFQEEGYEAKVAFLREGSDIRHKVESVAALEITVDSIDQAIHADHVIKDYIRGQYLEPYVY
jgi:hypothetical protein